MHDARDAEDKRLLEEKNHKLLLAAYFHPVRERCALRLRDRAQGDEAAQQVFVRLLAELERGRTYSVPFRVVVWKVTDWILRGFYPGAKEADSLPDGLDLEAPDAFAEWEADHDLDTLFSGLPPRERDVVDLRWRRGLEPLQIAERLGIERNAVDQALHRAHRKLREKLLDA